MLQSPRPLRKPTPPASVVLPALTGIDERRADARREFRRAPKGQVEFQEPRMDSALKPMLWLLVPFITMLVYGILDR